VFEQFAVYQMQWAILSVPASLSQVMAPATILTGCTTEALHTRETVYNLRYLMNYRNVYRIRSVIKVNYLMVLSMKQVSEVAVEHPGGSVVGEVVKWQRGLTTVTVQ